MYTINTLTEISHLRMTIMMMLMMMMMMMMIAIRGRTRRGRTQDEGGDYGLEFCRAY